MIVYPHDNIPQNAAWDLLQVRECNIENGQVPGLTNCEILGAGCQSVTVLASYAQCGGLVENNAYTPVDGQYPCTSCSEGTACTKKDAYYYQCLPYSGKTEAQPSSHVPS